MRVPPSSLPPPRPALWRDLLLLGRPGQTGGYNHEARDRDIPFTAKEEPATMPRVEELIIITEYSPWCTIVKNPQGVTLGDICTTLFKECVVAMADVCASGGRLTVLRAC